MKKVITKHVVKPLIYLLSAILCFTSVVFTREIKSASADDYEVWFANSETYIYQNEVYTEKDKSGLKISMAKNEYESGQIIITPSIDVKSYDIIVSPLRCGANTIQKENIEVFVEKYVYNKNENYYKKDKGYTTNSYVPDALVPFDKIKNAGENSIKAGENQGIYVRVKTEKDTPAGEYTAIFTVIIGNYSYNVPVSVKVYNAIVSDEVNTASIFMLTNDRLLNSIEGEATDEKLKTYYDFFLDYRINLMYLPAATNDTEKFLELLVEYYDNPAFTAYEIPYKCKKWFQYENPQLLGIMQPDLDDLQNTVYKIVALSIRDGKNYLEKGYIYNIYVDEFLLDSSRSTNKYNMGVKWGKDFSAWRERIVYELDRAYGEEYLNQVEGLRFSLENLTSLNAGSDVQVGSHILGNKLGYNSVMPEPDAFNDNRADSLKSDWSEEGDEIWWYTCVGPISPYPNYHLSNPYSLVDARLLSWMQYENGIYGNLYWSVADWVVRDGSLRHNIDIYEQQTGHGSDETNGGVYGDGLLIYPGAKYGMDTPISTMRLESIRDGLEDYTLLETISQKYSDLSVYYDREIDAQDSLKSIFRKAYNGTVAYKNTNNLSAVKLSLYESIESLESPAKILMLKSEAQGDKFTAEVLVSSDYTVAGAYSSVSTSGQGSLYTFRYNRGEDIYLDFTATKNDETIRVYSLLERAPITFISFDQESDLSLLTLTKGSNKEIAQIEGKTAAKLTIASSAKASEIATFKPRAEMDATLFKDVLGQANEFSLDIYNGYNEDVSLAIALTTQTKSIMIKTVTLKANSWQAVSINDISSFPQALKITFTFENIIKEGSAVNYPIYFSDFSYKRS